MALQPKDKPIAFCVSSTESLDIFEVKADCRKRGYGRILAEHVIAEARESGSMGLVGQCVPSDSVGFWKHMGFERIKTQRSGIWVAMPFRRHRDILDASSRIRIQVSSDYPETEALRIHETRASLDDVGYQLEDDFVEYIEGYRAVLTIWIDDNQVFDDRAKYGKNLGIECSSDWVRVTELAAQ